MYKSYAGVGSRTVPEDEYQRLSNIAHWLAESGWTLRSGGAHGCDRAFYEGAGGYDGNVEIYLPWSYYNRHFGPAGLDMPSGEALDIAREHHPAWHRCSDKVRLLLGRNAHIMLGADLDDPVGFVVCWKDPQGGTGTEHGLRIARAHGIPIFDTARRRA